MGRAPCCDTNGLKKGPWTTEEDQKLIDYIQQNGYGNWRTLPKNAGLQRCGKSCRLRWTNYLRPDIKRGRFSFEEEETIIQLHTILGNKWSAIAARLPGRTDNEIKNYWNTHIRKRLMRMGIDPVTHSPRLDLMDIASFLATSNLYHHNNQSSFDPELLRIATSLMSQSQNNNQVGDYYGQTLIDPTRLNHNQNQLQLQLDRLHNQSLMQIHAMQQRIPDYIPINDSNNTTHDPFTGLYYGAELDSGSGQRQSIVDMVNRAEQSSSAIFPSHNPMQTSVISTPSSSPNNLDYSNSNVYTTNSSCTSTADEMENYSIENNGCDYFGGLMRMMKFEIPQGFDVNEFIY